MAKPSRPDFRAELVEHKPLYSAWLSLGSALGVEIAADAGWDSVMIDQQHGVGGETELAGCLTAAKAAGVPAMVRVAELDFGLIGRALDAGAQGIMAPMMDTAEDAARLVQAVKFPPLGRRSLGPYRAKFMVDGDYFSSANSWTIACGQIETVQALENVEAICATEGLDMICLGPNDLAIALSGGKDRNIRTPEMLDAIERVRAAAAERGVVTGIFANDQDFARLMARTGWQVISIGTDSGWLAAMARQMLPR
jgi:4-hydroxy-2-oxoheptanedioate aldolase